MTEKMVRGYIESELRRLDFSYTEKNGYLLFTAGLGERRWKMALSCGENRLVCYAAYPWHVPRECYNRMLEWMNEINASACFGSCFLLDSNGDYLIVFRCDVIITDIYSLSECLENGFKHTSAAICARWNTLKIECQKGAL